MATINDSVAPAALCQCISPAAIAVDGHVISGLLVRWYVVQRPAPFDPAPLISLDDELAADLDDGEEWAVETVENLRGWLSETFTPDEAEALREYLGEAHGTALYTAPVSLPFKPRPDGDALALGRDRAEYPRRAGDLVGTIWLHRQYGYSLPFKVIGCTSHGVIAVDDVELRSMAIEMTPPGTRGVGL